MPKLATNYIKATWMRKNVLVILCFISFVHINVAMNTICNIRIDLIESLTKDGFIQNNYRLSKWFYRKYPACLNNYKNKKVDEEENVKENNNDDDEESIHHRIINGDVEYDDNNQYSKGVKSVETNKNDFYQRYSHDKDVDDEINSKRYLKLNEEVDTVNDILSNNVGRSLIGEWNQQTSGVFILLKDVKTSDTIKVDKGNTLDITGIVGVGGKRPAINGGGTPGCNHDTCPGHVVLEVDKGHLILTNLTIKNGFFNRPYDSPAGGIIAYGTLILTSCNVSSNTAIDSNFGGAGIFFSGGYAQLIDCTVSGNKILGQNSLSGGGGIIIRGGNITLTRCAIFGNTAPQGAGLCIEGGDVTMINCKVFGNTATTFHNSQGGGGGFYIHNYEDNHNIYITMISCTISNNDGGFYGGAIYSSSVNPESKAVVNITDCILSGNTANQGGAVFMAGEDSVTCTRCTVFGNTDWNGGQAFYIERGILAIIDSNITVGGPNEGSSCEAINTAPSVIVINTIFNGGICGRFMHVVGKLHSCIPGICHQTVKSYPDYGIDCINEPNKNGKYGMKCLPCRLGKYLAKNAPYPSCLSCLAGRATNKYGSESCDKCLPGQYQPINTNATLCKLCEAGKYSDNSIKCIDVPPGYYPSNCSDRNYKKGCSIIKPCPRGYNCPLRTTKPIQCLRGYYSNITGAPVCLKCNSGRASNMLKATECEACKEGKFANSAGSLKCTTCEAGKTTYVKGSVQCSDCAKGRVGINGNCNVCPFGKVATVDGSKNCTLCPAGEKPDTNNISCVKMDAHGFPPTRLSIKMGPNYTTLFVKWKLPSDVITPDDRVVIVPVDRVTNDDVFQSVWYGPAISLNAVLLNLDVYKKVYTLKISTLYKKDGSTSRNATYSKRWNTMNDCNTDDKYLNASSHDLSDWKCNKCPHGASCQGPITWNGVKARFGNWHIPNTIEFAKCIRPQSCLGAANNLYYDRFPKLAHKNNLNASCAAAPYVKGNPFVLSKNNRLCATCNRPSYARGTSKGSCVKCHKILNIIVFISSIIFGVAGFTLFLRMALFKQKDIKLSDGIKKIAINYLGFASLALNLDMPWTDVLRELFKWQSYGVGVSNAFLSLDCILADTFTTWEVFQLKFFGTLMLPIVFIPIAYVTVKCVLRGGLNEFIASLILFWYLMYPQILKSVTTLFACTDMIDGTKYLVVDPEVECYQYGIRVWIGIVFSFVVYIIGMPVISFLAVKRLDRNEATNRLKFGILYDGYDNKDYWWWELVIQVRKLSVILISAFIQNRVQQILLVLFVIVLSLFFTALLRPFYDDRLVTMEMLSLIVCFLTFFFGSMLLSDEKCVEDEEMLCVVAQWLVILINAGCVLFLGINFCQSWFTEKGDLVQKYFRLCKIKICCCFSNIDGSDGMKHRTSYVEMNVEDIYPVTNGIGELAHDGDEYHQL